MAGTGRFLLTQSTTRATLVLVGVASVPLGLAGSRESSVEVAADNAEQVIAVALPVYVALIWSSLNEAAAAIQYQMSGLNPSSQRRSVLHGLIYLGMFISITSIGIQLVVGATSGSMGGASLRDPSWQAILEVVLVSAVTVITVTALSINASRIWAVSVAILAPALLFATHVRALPGADLVGALWPPAGVQYIFGGEASESASLGLVALCSTVFVIAFAEQRTRVRVRSGDWVRRLHVPLGLLKTPWTHLAVAAAALTLVGGIVLPVGLSRDLPDGWRPSAFLDRWQGDAPDQTAARFFASVWAADESRSDRYVLNHDTKRLLSTYPQLREPSEAPSYSTVTLTISGRAEVLANLDSGPLYVCFKKSVDRWLIDKLSVEPCAES